MIVCHWHFEVPFGQQGEATKVLKEWADAMSEAGVVSGVLGHRVLVGHIGPSPSHVVAEWDMESLSAWEATLEAVREERFAEYSRKMASLIVPGSQRWEVWRPVD